MSALPADPTSVRTPNGGVLPMMRRAKQADPLVRPKDKKRRLPRPIPTQDLTGSRTNGSMGVSEGQRKTMPQHPGKAPKLLHRQSPALQDTSDPVSGFTSPTVAQYTDYPLVMTKKTFMDGMRHHVARFASKKTVDPSNSNEFVRPVRFQRRDPRAPAFGGGEIKHDAAGTEGGDEMDDKERAKQELIKAERNAQREAEMAQVAPSANMGGQKRTNVYKKKTQQIFRNDQTDEQKAESKLRYEEALPWHLEDFEGKQVWVGSYEAALSDTYAMLVHGKDGVFRMVPLQKWYKLTPKNQFKTLTIEEAESRMSQKMKDPRWFMDSQQATKAKENEQENKKATRGLFLGKWERGAGGGGSAAPKVKPEQADPDDLDFEEDRFADDEENVLFEGEDEETKQAEDRIKRDQLQANVFGLKEEKEYEKAEQEEKKEKDAEKKFGKGVKKALMKREKNYIYDSDSADNPYSEESESDDTENERLKAEERKKEEEKKPTLSDPDKNKLTRSKPSPGIPSKGTTSRGGKQPDALAKSSSSNGLKRPGSPHLSEASGTEASRKKHKKQHPLISQSQPLKPPSRPTSPPLAPPPSSAPFESIRPSLANSRKSSNSRLTADTAKSSNPRPDGKHSRSHAGTGSENEAAGSGGEMSDGSRKKLKLTFGKAPSRYGTPSMSRANSPELRGGDVRGSVPAASTPAAAATSAQASSAAPTQAISADLPFPTAAELRARIPPQGIKMGTLLGYFRGQIVGQVRKERFAALMRENSRFDKVGKMVLPLDEE